jgi:large subunit ribosomal protein L4
MMLGALRSALSAKVRDGALKVVDELALAEPRTKAMVGVLGALELQGSVLIVDNSGGRNVALGARNIPGVKVVASREVTTYDLLGHQTLLVSQAAATKLSETLA